MNIKKIKEAVEYFQPNFIPENANGNFHKNIHVLIDLAEQFLAVSSKMPEKYNSTLLRYHEGYNDAIEDCTLATVGMFLSEEKIRETFNNFNPNYQRNKLADELSKFIYKAQREKLR